MLTLITYLFILIVLLSMQNQLFRLISCAPWYLKNDNIQKGLLIPPVAEEIIKTRQNIVFGLTKHCNTLAA